MGKWLGSILFWIWKEITFYSSHSAETIVHPLDEINPLNEMDLTSLDDYDVEIMIQMEGFDETFGNTVHSRYSYLSSEIEVGGKFKPAFNTDEEGNVVIDIRDLHKYEKVPYKQPVPEKI